MKVLPFFKTAPRLAPRGLRQLQLAVVVAVVTVRMMQAAVMQIIDVPIVFHRDVAAAGAVLMPVVGMDFAVAHHDDGLTLKNRSPGAVSEQVRILPGSFA